MLSQMGIMLLKKSVSSVRCWVTGECIKTSMKRMSWSGFEMMIYW